MPDADASGPLRRGMPWCGECEDDQSRTITITLPDGTEAAAFCPRCSPQMRRRSVDRNVSDFSSMGVKLLENKVFDQLPLLLAVPRAAAILGISRASAYRLVATGELPSPRLGGRVYVVTAALRELVAA